MQKRSDPNIKDQIHALKNPPKIRTWHAGEDLAMTQALNTAILNLHKILEFMMIYLQAKFDCKRIISSQVIYSMNSQIIIMI